MRVIFAFCLFFYFTLSFGQTTLLGKCLDRKATPLAQVKISIEGLPYSSLSTTEGRFVLKLPQTSSLEGHLLLAKAGYKTLRIPIQFSSELLDLGDWVLQEVINFQDFIPVVDLGEQSSSLLDESPSLGSPLQSRRTVFMEAASFQFSSAFFSLRGLNRKYQPLRINGVLMNDFESGRAAWSQWGGLNDIFNRSQLVQYGLTPFGNYFGSILGGVELTIQPSTFRKGMKFSQAFSNRSYRWRSMFSLHTASSKKGWAFSGLVALRQGNQGYHQGTRFQSYSGLLSMEKSWKGKSSTWLTLWFTPTHRGRNAPLTQEVYDLKGQRYNPYWGYDFEKQRNTRINRVAVPYLVLNHQLHFSDNITVLFSGAYRKGEEANSRLLYSVVRPVGDVFIGGGRNPDPVYYQNLPSYFLRDQSNPNILGAYQAEKQLKTEGQINWGQLRSANATLSDQSARYALYEDVKDEARSWGGVRLFFDPKPGEFWNTAFAISQSNANYFAQPIDMLGASHLWDIDPYAETPAAAPNNLLAASPKVEINKPFLYNYAMKTTDLQLESLWSKSGEKGSFFLGGQWHYRSYQREGYFQNGGFVDNSFGKSTKLDFKVWHAKAGFSKVFFGRHRLFFSGGFFQLPPSYRTLFPNARENNIIVTNPVPEAALAFEVKYALQGQTYDFNITGYSIAHSHQNHTSFYFADGVGGEDAFFVQEVLTQMKTMHQGLEFGGKITVADVLDIKMAAAYGKHYYANAPHLSLYTAPSVSAKEAGFSNGVKDFGSSNLTGYSLANGPQNAYSLGFQYNDPNYWRINVTGNYLSNTYIQPNPLRRTNSFLLDRAGLPLSDVDPDTYDALLAQERFPAYFILNAAGGKSWKLKQHYFGFFVSLQNLLNTTYKTGGFEQGRNANYLKALNDFKRPSPLFDAKYWWGRGATFFTTIYYRF
ncbi:MAG: hypothetical protein ACPH03_06040 [Flavobacteriaceae bacterium]